MVSAQADTWRNASSDGLQSVVIGGTPTATHSFRCTAEVKARMKIRSIAAYRVELPLHEGSYKWSGGKAVTVFDSTIVRVETDAGIVGWGEVCPLGPFYLPAYANGARTGIAELAPYLLGEDPTQL